MERNEGFCERIIFSSKGCTFILQIVHCLVVYFIIITLLNVISLGHIEFFGYYPPDVDN